MKTILGLKEEENGNDVEEQLQLVEHEEERDERREKSKIPNKEKSSDLSVQEEDDRHHPPREIWSKKLDFLMSIIGFSVDLAGIWRL